jgi:ferritin-like protein
MATIQNYEIDPCVREQDIDLPVDAQILSVQMKGEKCNVSALVNVMSRTEKRRIEIYPAGATIVRHDELKHLATLVLHGGALVLHVFERVAA